MKLLCQKNRALLHIDEEVIVPPRPNDVVATRTDETNVKKGSYFLSTSNQHHHKLRVAV